MRKIVLSFTIILVVTSCGEKKQNKNQNSTTDTLMATEEVTPDLRKLRQEYILAYNKPIEFESFHRGKGDENLKVYGRYYCLFDSAIVVPGRYNLDDTTKPFKTHNFAEDVIIISNGDTILKKTIRKEDFADKLPGYLKDYAVIFEPKFEGYDSNTDMFDFYFSVSIPLTDVGQPMILSLKRNGEISVQDAE